MVLYEIKGLEVLKRLQHNNTAHDRKQKQRERKDVRFFFFFFATECGYLKSLGQVTFVWNEYTTRAIV